MKKYTQLSQDERYEIYATLKSKSSIATLARELGRSRSTIYRELKRNTGQRGYRAQQAAKFASQRRYRPSSPMTAFAFAYIDLFDWLGLVTRTNYRCFNTTLLAGCTFT